LQMHKIIISQYAQFNYNQQQQQAIILGIYFTMHCRNIIDML